jgi:diguanylate cyclase (GGDEF)-like protein
MPRIKLSFVLLPVALCVMAGAMVVCASLQRTAATRAAVRTDGASRLLTAAIDQETGLRGFLLVGQDQFLEPYRAGHVNARAAESTLYRTADGDRQTLQLLGQDQGYRRRWQALANAQIAEKRGDRRSYGSVDAVLERKALMDQVRIVNAALQARLLARRDDDLSAAARRSTEAILLLTLLIGLGALTVLRHESRRRRRHDAGEQAYRNAQREFTDIIQVVQSEPEAHGLLKRHLDLSIGAAVTTVLNRNNSDNRLEAMTPLAENSVLTDRLAHAEPASCLAVRLGRRHHEDPKVVRLLACELCGNGTGQTVCEPLLVGGQVIGSVLVEHEAVLGDKGDQHLADSVSQAAPVLANLRNLALAQRRAATDALTGLPNRRAVQDTLARMCAQASRNVQPLTAISVDLDHFKDINDRFGHDMGDRVLAQVSTLLKATLRASDFVGRLGGEEFIVLAPDTGLQGARTLAENLRLALESEAVAGLDRDITASFGVAVLPDHAGNADVLLRLSDRALYSAKNRGRNRVEVVDELSGTQIANDN